MIPTFRQTYEITTITNYYVFAKKKNHTDKKNTDYRQNLKIFNLIEKIREYQHNYFKHIPRIPAYRMPQNIFNYHPK
jgi:hypothetical protein